MIDDYDGLSPQYIFKRLKELEVSQVTFRKLYSSENDTKEDGWVIKHKVGDYFFKSLDEYVVGTKDGKTGKIIPNFPDCGYGNLIGSLSFGGNLYDVNGISTVIDNDCMNLKGGDLNEFRYLILRPDCHLYPKWEYSSIFF